MPKVAKVAVSLPEEMLAAVEEERRASGESRSQFFRRALETLLRLQHERQLSERYIRAYEQMPETKEEIEGARRAASDIMAQEPWE